MADIMDAVDKRGSDDGNGDTPSVFAGKPLRDASRGTCEYHGFPPPTSAGSWRSEQQATKGQLGQRQLLNKNGRLAG